MGVAVGVGVPVAVGVGVPVAVGVGVLVAGSGTTITGGGLPPPPFPPLPPLPLPLPGVPLPLPGGPLPPLLSSYCFSRLTQLGQSELLLFLFNLSLISSLRTVSVFSDGLPTT